MSAFTNKYLLSRNVQEFDLSLIEANINYYLVVPCFGSNKDFITVRTTKLQVLKASENFLGTSIVKGFVGKGRNGATSLCITSFVGE